MKRKFNKAINHSDSSPIIASKVIERELDPPTSKIFYVDYYIPKFDW